jgi:hypothetical protein
MMLGPSLRKGPIWFEVRAGRFGFYRIYECGGAVAGLGGQPRWKTTAWGLNRAIHRAERLHETYNAPIAAPAPVFSTKKAGTGHPDRSGA